MIKIELKYSYSQLDGTHCYYLENFGSSFDAWRWFHLGKNLSAEGKNFRLYPYDNNRGKTILTAKINDAEKQGEMIAKKINEHYKKHA